MLSQTCGLFGWAPIPCLLFDDSHGAMRLFMWEKCRKDVASCLLQLLDRIAETLT